MQSDILSPHRWLHHSVRFSPLHAPLALTSLNRVLWFPRPAPLFITSLPPDIPPPPRALDPPPQHSHDFSIMNHKWHHTQTNITRVTTRVIQFPHSNSRDEKNKHLFWTLVSFHPNHSFVFFHQNDHISFKSTDEYKGYTDWFHKKQWSGCFNIFSSSSHTLV